MNFNKIKKRIIKIALLRLQEKEERELERELNQKKEKFTIKKVNGSQMIIDTQDKGISLQLYVYGTRETESKQEFEKRLHEGAVVVDIGANIGFYALIESKRIGQAGKVYAIEPIPHNYKMLKANLELNEARNVECFKKAIGDRVGKAKMYYTEKINASSMIKETIKENKTKIKEEVTVELTTLDQSCCLAKKIT